MKKIVLLSLMTLSSGLLGTEYPNRQQPANRIPGPTQQQENQAFRTVPSEVLVHLEDQICRLLFV